MKISVLCIALFGFSILSPVTQAVDQSDAVLGFSYHDPKEDPYNDGFLFDAMLRGWFDNGLGFGVAGGAGAYRAEETLSSYDGATLLTIKASGNVVAVPIGMSALYQVPMGDNAILSFDAGLRYVLVNSNADLRATIVGTGTVKDDLDIDNAWIGVLGINYERQITDRLSWLVGGGYQFDVSEGEVEWMGIDLGDNELESVFVRLGLVFKTK